MKNNDLYVKKDMEINEALKLINFPVEKQEVFIYENHEYDSIPKMKAIVRTDTKKVFSVLSDDYGLIENEKIFSAPLSILNAEHGFYVNKVFLKDQGNKTMVEMLSKDDYRVEGKGDDLYKKKLTLLNSFDGSSCLKMIFGAFRLKCRNGAGIWQKEKIKISIMHLGKIEYPMMRKKLISCLLKYDEAFENYLINISMLQKIELKDKQVEKILTLLGIGIRMSKLINQNLYDDYAKKTLTMLSLYHAITQHFRDIEEKKKKIVLENSVRSAYYMERMIDRSFLNQIEA